MVWLLSDYAMRNRACTIGKENVIETSLRGAMGRARRGGQLKCYSHLPSFAPIWYGGKSRKLPLQP